MNCGREYSDNAIVESFGKVIKRYRISINMTQDELSLKSGVSVSTLERIENGNDTKFSNIIKILRVFGLTENLGMLIPDTDDDFKAFFEKKPERKRASKKQPDKTGGWVWGDDIKGGD